MVRARAQSRTERQLRNVIGRYSKRSFPSYVSVLILRNHMLCQRNICSISFIYGTGSFTCTVTPHLHINLFLPVPRPFGQLLCLSLWQHAKLLTPAILFKLLHGILIF